MRQPPDTPDENESIPIYDPRRSRLEPFGERIKEMREKGYPYRAIAEWLRQRGVAISWQGIRKFCVRRNIRKGRGAGRGVASPTALSVESDSRQAEITERIRAREARQKTGKRFHYDDAGKPIRTWKDEA